MQSRNSTVQGVHARTLLTMSIAASDERITNTAARTAPALFVPHQSFPHGSKQSDLALPISEKPSSSCAAIAAPAAVPLTRGLASSTAEYSGICYSS